MSTNDVRALSTADEESKLQRLKTLNLSKNTLTGTLHDLLSGDFTQLHTLLLEDTKLSTNDVLALAAASKLQCLIILNLSRNNLKGSLRVLLANEFMCLQTLLLEDTKLSTSDVRALSTAAWERKLLGLNTLNLSKNTLTGTLHDLLKGEFSWLHTLLLENTKLSTNDVQALAAAPKLQCLRILNLSRNNLKGSSRVLLANKSTILETLLLEETKLSARDMRALSTVVQEGKLPGLRTLNLSKNTLTNTLHDLLKGEFTQLHTLLLEDTKLSSNDLWALNTAVEKDKLQSLKTLNLSENYMGGGLGFMLLKI